MKADYLFRGYSMESTQTQVNYRDLIPRQNGFVFKFTKKDNKFIHTFTEGDFLNKIGVPPSMIVGKTLFDFLPEAIAQQKHQFYEIAWNGTPANYEGTINNFHYICSLNPILINGETVEVNGTAIDITEEKENELKLRQMEKLSLVGELAAGIAHEIRNPLTSITGFAQILNESIDNPKLIRYLEIMLDELARINHIVTEFMYIAKPHENMELRETDINKLISTVIQFMEPQFNLKNILISVDFDSTILTTCDPNQMKQVLINLIQNAIEATTSNHHIDISLKKVNGHYYSIQIKDRGCGISKERQKRLFEPFYTTKEKGTGLGLMMCKRIIENHNGTIELKSKHDEGTVVTIQLPLPPGETHTS